jgi:putative flippase GtrA
MPVAPPTRQGPVAALAMFFAVGGLAALSYVLLSTAAIAWLPGLPAWLVAAACYALHVPLVYLLHRRLSFRSDAAHRRALPRYVLVQLAGIAFATLLSWGLHDVAQLPPILAGILIIALTSGLTFVLLRRWAFSTA